MNTEIRTYLNLYKNKDIKNINIISYHKNGKLIKINKIKNLKSIKYLSNGDIVFESQYRFNIIIDVRSNNVMNIFEKFDSEAKLTLFYKNDDETRKAYVFDSLIEDDPDVYNQIKSNLRKVNSLINF